MLLAEIGEKMIVEETRSKFFIDHPAVQADGAKLSRTIFADGLAAACAGQIIPSGCRAIGAEHIKLYQMNVQPALNRMLRKIKAIGGEGIDAVEMPPLDNVAVVRAGEECGRVVIGCFFKFLAVRDVILAVCPHFADFDGGEPVPVGDRIVPAIDIIIDMIGDISTS